MYLIENNAKKQSNTEEIILNADAHEILKKLHQVPGNSAIFRAKDFTFGQERFVRALNSLFYAGYIDSTKYTPNPFNPLDIMNKTMFSFEYILENCDAEVEIIKTDAGKKYLNNHP